VETHREILFSRPETVSFDELSEKYNIQNKYIDQICDPSFSDDQVREIIQHYKRLQSV